ncbi:hypothetical protein Mtc_1416 [Methanocella conradii HZ254]|uniref:DUF4350 domain-containing protein n=1 Tax=Methanocella conradii (strain DSM 24694 / JCM 17849 / CGMCC 1.5162 / HZ254) TaxID=1041930 RepID=H8I4J1_METCZ|nr:DUF4350 domain-containing protein [Methanocella conradii]AFD00170.1 hypothetical protein Mtc_1416 [Methanocella conradii HZ254]
MKKATALVSIVCLIAIAVLSARFFFSEADFAMTNPSWNGLYALSSEVGARPLYSLSSLSDKGGVDTLLIIGPANNYNYDESLEVSSFLSRGGTVVVMDDFGASNSMLHAISSPISINSVPLCQHENYYVNMTFPIISDVSETPFTRNVSSLVLNHPAALNVTGDARVIASTSRYAWLDLNHDSMLDDGERTGVYPVAASCDYGNGKLLVFSDADIFINSMLGKGDNRALLKQLLAGSVWVDVSHGHGMTPLGSIYYMLRYDLAAQLVAMAITIAFTLAVAFKERIGRMIKRLANNKSINGPKNGLYGDKHGYRNK